MPLPIRLIEEDRQLCLVIGERKLTMHNGDVLSLAADALVCPVDQNLDFRAGIARIISQAAGKGIRKDRPSLPEPYGKVVVLPGGNLKVKYIFLSVIVGEKGPERMKTSIRQAVERTIRYAEFLRLKSIAFPVLGSSHAAAPYDFIAREMLEEVTRYFQRRNTRLNAILFSVFNPQAFEAFRREAKDIADL